MTKQKTNQLGTLALLGFSLSFMSPAMAVGLNPQVAFGLVGAWVPISFAVATLAVLLINRNFSLLSQSFESPGSLFGFAQKIAGNGFALVSGGLLAAAYLGFAIVTFTATVQFSGAVLIGSASGSRSATILLSLAFLAILFLTRFVGIHRLIVVLGWVQVITISAVLLVLGSALVQSLSAGTVDFGRVAAEPSMSGTPWFVALFSASLVGFLSFAGYEAVLAIRDLASADRGVASAVMSRSAVFGGVFFIVATAIEVFAFSALKLGSPQASSNLLVEIAGSTLGTWSEVTMVIVTGLSALACCQVALISCARIIGAMAKDFAKPRAFVPTAIGAANIRLVGSLLAAVALLAVVPVWMGVEPRAVFELAANVGTLLLLVSYGIACWLASRVQQPESAKTAQRFVSYSGLALVAIVFASFLISVL